MIVGDKRPLPRPLCPFDMHPPSSPVGSSCRRAWCRFGSRQLPLHPSACHPAASDRSARCVGIYWHSALLRGGWPSCPSGAVNPRAPGCASCGPLPEHCGDITPMQLGFVSRATRQRTAHVTAVGRVSWSRMGWNGPNRQEADHAPGLDPAWWSTRRASRSPPRRTSAETRAAVVCCFCLRPYATTHLCGSQWLVVRCPERTIAHVLRVC